MNIDITYMTIENLRIDTTADLSDTPTLRYSDTWDIDVRPYGCRAVLRRDDVDEPWRCSTVVLYGHETGDVRPVPRIFPVQFNDVLEDWSDYPESVRRFVRRPQAPEWVKELAGRLIAEVTP